MQKYNIINFIVYHFCSIKLVSKSSMFFKQMQNLGDSAYWAITAIDLFDQKKYEEAVAVVDLVFRYYGRA